MSQADIVSTETRMLAEYIAGAADMDLPEEVDHRARLHLLDTLASIVSGSALLAGRKAAKYVREHSQGTDALVIGTDFVTDAVHAALANGMSAHADETDDSHTPSRNHPGCAIVPAAFAAAERKRVGGMALLRAVVTGYDVGTRVCLALGPEYLRGIKSTYSSHAYGGIFGAMAAAATIERLNEQEVRYALSYTAQMASGVTSWLRDGKHVEKAYVFGGMTARNGLTAVLMAKSGLDGVEDVFAGEPNFMDVWSPAPRREELVDGLGTRFEITDTNIKKYTIGSPAQSVVQATVDIMSEHGVTAADVESIEIRIPSHAAHVVDNRSMPDINVQYLVAGTLIDGDCTFELAHDEERMRHDPQIHGLMQRMTLIADQEMEPIRQAKVKISTESGEYERHVNAVRGSVENPMSRAEVESKAHQISQPVLGDERARRLIQAIRELQDIDDVTDLRAVLKP